MPKVSKSVIADRLAAAKSPEEIARIAEEQLGPERTAELRAEFRSLPLSNGFMFGEVMRTAALCIRFLELLLKVQIERVEYIAKEHDISQSFTGHGIRIDVYLRDGKGTVYSIEMDTGGSLSEYKRRMRYNQSAIDRNNLKKGEDYVLLPDMYLIVVSTKDFFGHGLALYVRKMMIKGYKYTKDGKEQEIPDFSYEDGTHLYFLNADHTVCNVSEEIAEFLKCIHSNDTDPEHYKSQWMKDVCRRIEEVRDDPAEEAYYMTLDTMVMDIRREAREEGREEGREEERFSIIQNLMKTLGKGAAEVMDMLLIPADERAVINRRFAAQ